MNEDWVEITDEALVPEELCMVTVTMPAWIWSFIGKFVEDQARVHNSVAGELVRDIHGLRATRAPSLSLIAEALQKPCPTCASCGPCNEILAGLTVDCPDCGGSGQASVPGARLKPVGAHVEVK